MSNDVCRLVSSSLARPRATRKTCELLCTLSEDCDARASSIRAIRADRDAVSTLRFPHAPSAFAREPSPRLALKRIQCNGSTDGSGLDVSTSVCPPVPACRADLLALFDSVRHPGPASHRSQTWLALHRKFRSGSDASQGHERRRRNAGVPRQGRGRGARRIDRQSRTRKSLGSLRRTRNGRRPTTRRLCACTPSQCIGHQRSPGCGSTHTRRRVGARSADGSLVWRTDAIRFHAREPAFACAVFLEHEIVVIVVCSPSRPYLFGVVLVCRVVVDLVLARLDAGADTLDADALFGGRSIAHGLSVATILLLGAFRRQALRERPIRPNLDAALPRSATIPFAFFDFPEPGLSLHAFAASRRAAHDFVSPPLAGRLACPAERAGSARPISTVPTAVANGDAQESAIAPSACTRR